MSIVHRHLLASFLRSLGHAMAGALVLFTLLDLLDRNQNGEIRREEVDCEPRDQLVASERDRGEPVDAREEHRRHDPEEQADPDRPEDHRECGREEGGGEHR